MCILFSDKQMLTLLYVLSVFQLALTTTTEENTTLCRTGEKYNYEHLQYGDFCCRSCHAGFHMKIPCIAGRPETTECARCRYGTYTEGPNLLRHCFNQPQCDDGRRQIKRPGSIANRQECECKDGFYESPSGELCLPWTVCGIGYGVATPGSVTRDVVCEKCPAGTYSDQEDMTMPCFPHTNCEKLGLTILKNGTDSSDSVCAARAITQLPVTTVAVTRLPDDEGQGSGVSASPPFKAVDVDRQTAKENSDGIGFHGDTDLTIRNEDDGNWKIYFIIATAIFGLCVITTVVAIFICKKMKQRAVIPHHVTPQHPPHHALANDENDGDVAPNDCTTTTGHRRDSGRSVRIVNSRYSLNSIASPLQEAEPASNIQSSALHVSPQGPSYNNTVMGSSGRNGDGNDENGVFGNVDAHGDVTSIHDESNEEESNLWNIHPVSQMGSVTSLIRESNENLSRRRHNEVVIAIPMPDNDDENNMQDQSESESGLDQEPLLQGSS